MDTKNELFNKIGVTRLENNLYVLIKEQPLSETTAEIITDKKAFELIMTYNPDLLNENKFKEFREYKEKLIKESN